VTEHASTPSIVPEAIWTSELLLARAARYAAYAFMVCMPWATVFMDPVNPHDGARMWQSVVMSLAACALARCGGPWYPVSTAGRCALLSLVLFGGLSVLAADKPTYAGLEASAAVLLVVVAAVIARTDATILLRELPGVLATSALMSVLMELPRWAFFLADGRVPQAADFGFMYMSHRFFNHAQSLILPMAFLPLLVPAARWVRTAAWIGVTGGLALLWRTGGRGTVIAMVVFAIALPWILKSQAKQVLRTFVLAALGGMAVYAAGFVLPAWLLGLAQEHGGNATTRLATATDSGRFYLWKVALDDVMRHPWIGVGPMHYAHLPNLLAAHPHNSVAQWAAEWGIPVTACALTTLGTLLGRAAKDLRRATQAPDVKMLLVIAGLATLVGAIDSLVSGTLVMPVSQMWWFIAIGCMLACSAEPRSYSPDAGASVRWIAVTTLVALHVALSAITYQRSIQPPEPTPTGLQRTNVPRYWINGFF